MLNLVESSIHQPLTMLWPSDAALSSLSEERQHWLYSLDHRDKLTAIIKAHIIRNIKVRLWVHHKCFWWLHDVVFDSDLVLIITMLISLSLYRRWPWRRPLPTGRCTDQPSPLAVTRKSLWVATSTSFTPLCLKWHPIPDIGQCFWPEPIGAL